MTDLVGEEHILYWAQPFSNDEEWHCWRSDEVRALCGFEHEVIVNGPLTTLTDTAIKCEQCRILSQKSLGDDEIIIAYQRLELVVKLRMLLSASADAETTEGHRLKVLPELEVLSAIADIDAYLEQEGYEVVEDADDNAENKLKD